MFERESIFKTNVCACVPACLRMVERLFRRRKKYNISTFS